MPVDILHCVSAVMIIQRKGLKKHLFYAVFYYLWEQQTLSPCTAVSDSLYPKEAFSISEERDGENGVEGPIKVEDMDECLIYEGNICQHRCVNTPGSFRCECFAGYVLQEDAFTCVQGIREDHQSCRQYAESNSPCHWLFEIWFTGCIAVRKTPFVVICLHVRAVLFSRSLWVPSCLQALILPNNSFYSTQTSFSWMAMLRESHLRCFQKSSLALY